MIRTLDRGIKVKISNNMRRRGALPNKRKFFSLTASIALILSTILVGISIQVPNATAGTPENHYTGNVKLKMLTDWGRILFPIKWGTGSTDNGVLETVGNPASQFGFIGLVMDHDNYIHTPGAEDIADCFGTGPFYSSSDDFQTVNAITMIIDSATTQKSIASFQNKGAGYPDDILINQTAWTVLNNDWAIIQWNLSNKKGVDLTNISIGLELPLSVGGGSGGLGGDSGDDIDGYDAVNNTYWAQDNDGTTVGFASASTAEPITHYYSADYGGIYTWDDYKLLYENETWLYERLRAPNSVVGATPGNRSSIVGWDNFDMSVGSSKIVTLVIAMGDSFDDMTATVQDAQFYYNYVVSGFRITEFCDEDSGTQYIEVYNYGKPAMDLYAAGYRLSVNGGPPFLTGDNWNKKPLPTYEYGVFTLSSGDNIPSEGGTIGLYKDEGGGNYVLADEVSYGQKGTAPDPLGGESVARRYDMNGADYTDEWLRCAPTGPTWGSENDVGIITDKQLVLNRVIFNPLDPVEAYVELMYTGSGTLGISGYKIVCDDEFTVPAVTLSSTNRFYVLTQSNYPPNFDLDDGSVNGDNVYLYDNANNLLDMVGWSSSHNQGYFMSRIPDGDVTSPTANQGYDDTTSQAAGWDFDQLPSLLITEFYVDSSRATIELYNPRGGDKYLNPTGPDWWTLDSSVDPGGALAGNWNPTIILCNGGYATFTMSAGPTLGEEGDTITLYYDTGSGPVLVDEVSFGTYGVAPDPLWGESTARYWDNSIPGYNDDWNRDPSDTLFGGQNDVPPINPIPIVILNEVMFNPGVVPDGGYVVLLAFLPVDITGYSLVCDDVVQFTGPIAPGFAMFSYAPAVDQFFANMSFSADNVYLYDNNGQLLDMIGWNTPHLQGMSARRVPDGNVSSPTAYQGYNDITSEAAGWVFNRALQILMTEISDNGSAVAQIEVYNFWYPSIDFDVGFTFNSSSTGAELSGSWMIQTVDSGEYAVFNVTSNGLDQEGDTISLIQNGILIEEISYGQKGAVPDPLAGESVERYWDGAAYTDVWERNYTTGPNFGLQNDVPPDNLSSAIILNEVLFNPNTPGDAFVELYNRGGAPVNISGYKIVCDTEFVVSDGTVITFDKRFYYLLQSMDPGFFDPANMSASGDNIYLYDASGSLVDMVGWNSPHNISESMSRIPEGNGTKDGYDDASSIAAGWQFNCLPTVKLITMNTVDLRVPIKFGHFGEYVVFNLSVTNLQAISDIINILNSSEEGWIVEIYDETGTVKITNISLNPDESGNFTVKVTLPETIPFANMDNITITVRSSSSQIIGDFMVLTAKVFPFVNITKTATPYKIYVNGTGHDEIATITLNLTGMGAQVRERMYLDCVFCIDSSGSMGGNDDQNLRILESQNFVANHFEVPDRAAIVDFDSDADLLPPGYPPGDPLGDPGAHLRSDYARIIENFSYINSGGGTSVSAGLNASNEELRLKGYPDNHTLVIILLTDAQTSDVPACMQEANIAASRGVTIFTIGLKTNGTPNEQLLIDIANITGGMYFDAPDATYFKYIYENISQYLNDIAVWDNNTADPNPLVRDVLPPDIELLGNFSIQPDNVYKDPVTDETVIEWNIEWIKLGETFSVSFDIRSNSVGKVYTNVYDKSRAFYTRWDYTTDTKLFPECWVNVLPPGPVPPKLYIDVSLNKNDIYLYWDEPLSLGTDHYLIYSAPDPRGFDFSSPWVDTNNTLANGVDPGDNLVIPSRRSWNHTGAALPGHGNYSEHWYYCVRTVNSLGEMSSTSRTVGKWTKEFTQQGVSTFSLPLEPLETMNTTADFYLTDMGADYIKWMDPFFHNWMKHGDGGVNDTQLEVGKGYEVKFSSPTKYTFLGMPGAMIKYNNLGSYLGFDPDSTAKDLSATPDEPVIGDITLQWSPLGPPTTNYYVYYSTTRDGFHGTEGLHYHEIAILPVGTTSFVHSGVALPNTQYYYMIIPVNVTGAEGASTYSIGVWTEGYLAQYDTLGIPLILTSYPTADWYCDQMNDVVGINFFIFSEQRWSWHSTRMPTGAFDPVLDITEGYQISTSGASKFTFVGY